MKVRARSFPLPATALIGLCPVGFSMAGGTSATIASDSEVAVVRGGCGPVYAISCGIYCQGGYHLPGCANGGCTGTAGFGSVGGTCVGQGLL